MASLNYAYSKEIDDIIDAELAYELFWNDVIKDKKAFSCPDPNCNANVTCANMDTPNFDLKQNPHFRAYDHSSTCEIDSMQKKNLSPNNAKGNVKTYNLDELLLSRPDYKRNHNTIDIQKVIDGKIYKGINPRNKEGINNYNPRYFTIRSLVTKLSKIRSSNEDDQYFIKIGEEQISYKELFIGIFDQNLENLPSKPRIYWGSAFLDKVESKNLFTVRFSNDLKYNNLKLRPSFLLHEDLIKMSKSKLIKKRIQLFADIQPHLALVFIYGMPYINQKGNKTYINFKLENLDLLDVRDFDFLQLLKRNY